MIDTIVNLKEVYESRDRKFTIMVNSENNNIQKVAKKFTLAPSKINNERYGAVEDLMEIIFAEHQRTDVGVSMMEVHNMIIDGKMSHTQINAELYERTKKLFGTGKATKEDVIEFFETAADEKKSDTIYDCGAYMIYGEFENTDSFDENYHEEKVKLFEKHIGRNDMLFFCIAQSPPFANFLAKFQKVSPLIRRTIKEMYKSKN